MIALCEISAFEINHKTDRTNIALLDKLMLFPGPDIDNGAATNWNALVGNALNTPSPEIEEDLLAGVRMRLHLLDLIYVLMEGEALDMEAWQPDVKFFEKYVLIKLSRVTKKDPRYDL